MEKPNTPPFGGKGLFGFCLEEEYQLEDPLSILRFLISLAANSSVRNRLLAALTDGPARDKAWAAAS